MAPHLHSMVVAAACCSGALFASPAAAEFVISPVRLELGAANRSGAITVRNQGSDRLAFQLEAMEWRQDADGQDQYLATQELVFFPRIMNVEAGQDSLVRVGAKTPLVQTEKTYRLFIQELPGPAKSAQGKAAQVNFLIRFGAPIFVGPAQPRDSLAIETLALAKGAISLSAHNTGNRHQVVQGVFLKGVDGSGNEVYSLTLADRYLLAGATKNFSASVPAGECARMASLSVEVRTDRLSAVRKLDVDPNMCP
jgi:fimbrial chaperone protein